MTSLLCMLQKATIKTKTPTSSQRENVPERYHSSVGYIFTSAFPTLGKENLQKYQHQKLQVSFMLLSKSTFNFHHDVEVIFLPTSP